MVWIKIKSWGPKIADSFRNLKVENRFSRNIVLVINSIYLSLLQAATSWCKAEGKKLIFFSRSCAGIGINWNLGVTRYRSVPKFFSGPCLVHFGFQFQKFSAALPKISKIWWVPFMPTPDHEFYFYPN